MMTPDALWDASTPAIRRVIDSVKLRGETAFLIRPVPASLLEQPWEEEPRIRDGNFTFKIPLGWRVEVKGRASDGLSTVKLIAGRGGELIEIRHRNLRREVLAARRRATDLEGTMSSEFGGMFGVSNWRAASKRQPVGVFGKLGVRNFKHPELAMLTSAVCSSSDMALSRNLSL